MKHLAYIVIIFSFCLSCESVIDNTKDNRIITEGWVTPNIYRVTATGNAKPNHGYPQTKQAAKYDAIEKAQKKIIQNITLMRTKMDLWKNDFASAGLDTSKDIGPLASQGTIIRREFPAKNSCKIIFQIESKGLQKLVENGKLE